MCFEQISAFFQSAITPVIAIIALYIAWQQWQTNKQKHVLDRYDRRLRIYEEVRKILSIIMRANDASLSDLIQFHTSVSEADFLFGSEIATYLEEIYQHGIELRSWNSQYRDMTQETPEGYDHKKIVDGMHSELGWLTTQFEPAKQKFKKYLDVSR